jgi:branched-chain amino acid transport system permease protein
VAAAVGIVFGAPSLRVRGLYLAVATLAAQFFSTGLSCASSGSPTIPSSGSVSVADISLFGWTINTPTDKYLFCLGILVAFSVMAKNWCAETWVGSGWRFATWTWRPP